MAIAIPAIVWLLSELLLYYEWFATGARSRAELGDDPGFGMLLFFVVPPGTVVGTAWVGVWVWRRTEKSGGPNLESRSPN